MASFETGATRNVDDGKLDYEGFLSPLVLERYAQYLHKNRHCKDGSFRDSDNWQLGIPLNSYMKSAWRHFHHWWKGHRKLEDLDEDAICALIFNASGYLHEILRARLANNPMPIVGSGDGITSCTAPESTAAATQASGYRWRCQDCGEVLSFFDQSHTCSIELVRGIVQG